MDPTVQVALIGIFVTVITTIGLVVITVINSRKEKSDSAQKALESVHRERLEFKDEIIADLRSDLVDAYKEIMTLKAIPQEEREKGRHGRHE